MRSPRPHAAALRRIQPVQPPTTIAATVAPTRRVSIVVYDASGRVVRTLVSGVQPYGPHLVVWDGTDDRGQDVTSGVRSYHLTTGSLVESRELAPAE